MAGCTGHSSLPFRHPTAVSSPRPTMLYCRVLPIVSAATPTLTQNLGSLRRPDGYLYDRAAIVENLVHQKAASTTVPHPARLCAPLLPVVCRSLHRVEQLPPDHPGFVFMS